MASLLDVAWLLPVAGFFPEASSASVLNTAFAHDGRLLGGLSRDGMDFVTHAATTGNLSRLSKLLEFCDPSSSALAAALSGGNKAAARLLLAKGERLNAAIYRLALDGAIGAALSSSGTLLRELCEHPSFPPLSALLVGAACGFVDVITATRTIAFDGIDESTFERIVHNGILPFDVLSARALAEHPLFTTSVCIHLATTQHRKTSFPGAAVWVNELCLRIVGDDVTPELLNSALVAAAATGAIDSVHGLLARGAVFPELDVGIGGLLLAASRGHVEVLRRLYTTPDAHNTNLLACVVGGLSDCADDLIVNHFFAPDSVSHSMDCTLLSLACYNGDFEMVSVLLAHGADPAWRPPGISIRRSQDPWFMLLCIPHYTACVGVLPKAASARLGGRVDIATLLVSRGSRPDAKVIAVAAAGGCADLLDKYCAAYGDTVAAAATAALPFSSHATAVKRLLGAGATVGPGQLVPACKLRKPSWGAIAAMLAAPGACSVNARDERGRTALSWAALKAKTTLVVALLGSGADPAIADSEGHTPLDLALSSEPTGADARFAWPERWAARIAIVADLLRLASPLPPSPLPPRSGGLKRRASGELERPGDK